MKWVSIFFICLSLFVPHCRADWEAQPKISAESAILVDADSGRILFEKNAREKRLIASTTKLMTALVALESTPHLDKVITVQPECQAEGSSMYLRVGEELTLEELLYGLLLASGNDAALAIAQGCAGDVETFVDWMNEWATELGMTDSHFANPNGLDAEGHYATAYDMTILARAVLQNETLRKMVATRSITVAGRTLTNHNKLLWRYDGCMGMKTGYTEAAGRTLVSCAERDGQTLICVTLNDRNDWEDHSALFDFGFQNWNPHLLARAGKTVRTLPVRGSLLPQAAVATATDVVYPLYYTERVNASITLPAMVIAPVKKGDIAGKITFQVEENVVGETYLLYTEDVPATAFRPSLIQQIRELLQHGREGVVLSFAAFWLNMEGNT